MVTSIFFLELQDILPGCNRDRVSNKKVDTDSVLPFIIVPILLVTGTISKIVTIAIIVVVGMGALYVLSRPRQKNRSPFFFSWTMSSILYMYLVYQLKVLKILRITWLENFVFLIMCLCTFYLFYKMKAVADFELATGSSKGKEYSPVLTSDSHYCQICQIEVNERYFHSIWWNCCVFKPNYRYFLAAQIFAFATLLYGLNLSLTTVCQPVILYRSILMPEDCTDVYDEFNLAICFVTSIYGIGYLLVIALVLVHQLFVFIPKCTERQWRKLVNVL